MKRTLIAICLLVALGAAVWVFLARQQTLAELRSQTEDLRQRLEEGQTAPASVVAPDVPESNAVVQLTPDEQRELLRLRGEVLPLRRELQDLSNQVALARQPRVRTAMAGRVDVESSMTPEARAQLEETRASAMALMQSDRARNAQRLGRVLRNYLSAHDGHPPGDLAELERTALVPEGATKDFELLSPEPAPGDGPSKWLVAREKEPPPATNGVQTRFYIRSDGAIQFVRTNSL